MKRNAEGEMPYDLSLTCGCPPMVQLLAAQLGHTLLGTLLPNPAPSAWSSQPPAAAAAAEPHQLDQSTVKDILPRGPHGDVIAVARSDRKVTQAERQL